MAIDRALARSLNSVREVKLFKDEVARERMWQQTYQRYNQELKKARDAGSIVCLTKEELDS